MTSREFAYWLQGFFELRGAVSAMETPKGLNTEQVDATRKHLNMVFIHEIDPSYPVSQQADLSRAHAKINPHGVTPGVDVFLKC